MSFVSVDVLERELRKLEATPASPAKEISRYPVEFATSVGIEPDDWQIEVLASDHPRKILCCGRQTGKTTAIALLVAHRAITVPGSEILIVAPAERQAKRLFRVAKLFWRKAGEPHSAVSDRLTGLELGNGSVIEAVAAVEHTTRGFSPTLAVGGRGSSLHALWGLLPVTGVHGAHKQGRRYFSPQRASGTVSSTTCGAAKRTGTAYRYAPMRCPVT